MTSAVLESYVEEKPAAQLKPVDREKTCPLLLRVFCGNGRHHRLNEYVRGSVPSNELQIYTWLDCTLRELTGLIKEVNQEARRPGTHFEFSIVRPDDRGQLEMRDFGSTTSGQKGLDDNKSLAELKFTIGDYIDVAVHLPENPMRGGGMMRRGRGGGGEFSGRGDFGGRGRGGGGGDFGGFDRRRQFDDANDGGPPARRPRW